MSRNENDNLENVKVVNIKSENAEEVSVPDPHYYQYTCITSKGEVIESKSKHIKDTCAYCFEGNEGRIKYFVLASGGSLFDPEKAKDLRYNRRHNWKMKSVDYEVFKLYTQYLGVNKEKARRQTLLLNAERLL